MVSRSRRVVWVEDGVARHGRSVLAVVTGDTAAVYARRFGDDSGPESAESRALRRFDLILVAAKSVSVLWAVSRQEPRVRSAVAAAQEAGCRAAVAVLEQQVGEVLVAGFDHRYNSAKDPEVHTHLIVMPMMGDGSGGWVPVDEVSLFAGFPAAEAVYAATYRAELGRSLEAEWRAPGRDGAQELVDVPPKLVRRCSKPCLPLTQVEACR